MNRYYSALLLSFVLSTTAHAQKSQTAPYLKEAKRLLPVVGIELEPGDGGEVASAGKLLYENLLPIHVKLALAQKDSGDVAGAEATLLRARALCTGKKGTYQSLVTLLVNEGLRAGYYSESVAFHKKHDIDGFRAPLLAEYELAVRKDPKAATATLLVGIERGKSLESKGKALEKDSDDRWTRVTTLFHALDVATRHNLSGVADSARAALLPYVEDLSAIDLCRAVSLGVPGISPADAESKLRSETGIEPGRLALGLLYLKKEPVARAALKTAGKNADLPVALIFSLKPAEFAALASERTVRTTLAYLRQEGRETPETVRILRNRLLEDPTLPPAKRAAAAKAEFLGIVKDGKKNPSEKGSYQYSAQQSQYAEMLTEIVPLDPTFAAAQLSKIVEPRYRLVVLIELAAHYAKK